MDLVKQRTRTITIIAKYYSCYKYSNKTEKIIVSSSLLNIIWNNWCQFWRNYWIFNICGGIYLDKIRYIGIYPSLSPNQACAYAAHLRSCSPIRSYNYGDYIQHYQEPTWGDYDRIVNIATNLSNHPQLSSRMNYIISILPAYMNELKDFQKIRNSFVHLNYGAIKDLENIKSNYIFSCNSDILDILNARRIGNTSPCFLSMTDNMIGLLKNLYEG